MVTKTVTILNESGLHARPATEFVETAKRFHSKIKINRSGEDAVNAKIFVIDDQTHSTMLLAEEY